ncbi:MAG: 3-oxoacyl-[acyl-carrier-protein] synthase III C-terminal domain-containing protein, partial [Deltaproteobacteria bacterium]|nr:3-oxoacyl-[acyl-carrier-protein] synthase III C-terminal domain-containing protein [Deltaproteobacteria bacterium]
PPSRQMLDDNLQYIQMQGRDVFKLAVRAMEESAREALESNNLSPQDIDLYIPHQANIRIINSVAERLQIPREKVYVNIHKYGNTSAATIPIALDEANREGRIKEGDMVMLNAFGGGFTWGASLIRW